VPLPLFCRFILVSALSQKEGVSLPPPEGVPGTEATSTSGTASNPSDSVAALTPVKHDGPGIGTPGSGAKRPVDSLSREELILLVHKMRARIKMLEKRHAGLCFVDACLCSVQMGGHNFLSCRLYPIQRLQRSART
jgi:hypothetical protein